MTRPLFFFSYCLYYLSAYKDYEQPEPSQRQQPTITRECQPGYVEKNGTCVRKSEKELDSSNQQDQQPTQQKSEELASLIKDIKNARLETKRLEDEMAKSPDDLNQTSVDIITDIRDNLEERELWFLWYLLQDNNRSLLSPELIDYILYQDEDELLSGNNGYSGEQTVWFETIKSKLNTLEETTRIISFFLVGFSIKNNIDSDLKSVITKAITIQEKYMNDYFPDCKSTDKTKQRKDGICGYNTEFDKASGCCTVIMDEGIRSRIRENNFTKLSDKFTIGDDEADMLHDAIFTKRLIDDYFTSGIINKEQSDDLRQKLQLNDNELKPRQNGGGGGVKRKIFNSLKELFKKTIPGNIWKLRETTISDENKVNMFMDPHTNTEIREKKEKLKTVEEEANELFNAKIDNIRKADMSEEEKKSKISNLYDLKNELAKGKAQSKLSHTRKQDSTRETLKNYQKHIDGNNHFDQWVQRQINIVVLKVQLYVEEKFVQEIDETCEGISSCFKILVNKTKNGLIDAFFYTLRSPMMLTFVMHVLTVAKGHACNYITMHPSSPFRGNYTLVNDIKAPGVEKFDDKKNNGIVFTAKQGVAKALHYWNSTDRKYYKIDSTTKNETEMTAEEIKKYLEYQKKSNDKTRSQVRNMVEHSLVEFTHILPGKMKDAAAPIATFIDIMSYSPFTKGVAMLLVSCLLDSSQQAFTDYINTMMLLKKYKRLMDLLNPNECFQHRYITAQGGNGGTFNLLDSEHITEMSIMRKCGNMSIQDILDLPLVKSYINLQDRNETDSDIYASARLLTLSLSPSSAIIPSFARTALTNILTKRILERPCQENDSQNVANLIKKYNETMHFKTDDFGEFIFSGGSHDNREKRNNTHKSHLKTLRSHHKYKRNKSKKIFL